jgi:hypothetical protein
MLSERRLLHEEHNALNRIVVKESCVISVAKVVWISQSNIIHVAGFPKFDAYCVGHCFQPFE